MLKRYRFSVARWPGLTLPIILVIAALSGFAIPRSAQAATTTIIVNTNSDDSICTKLISLRCAIAMANGNTSSPTNIIFNFNGAIYVNSPLLISNLIQPVIVDGSNHSISIDGGYPTLIFNIAQKTTVLLNSLDIVNGSQINFPGGGIYNAGTLTVSHSMLSNNSTMYNNDGGGIYNVGILLITESNLSDNSTSYGCGGGIYNAGMLTVTKSTVFNNSAGTDGGGIYNTGILMIDNITISGNSANAKSEDRIGGGGGVYNADTGRLRINNSTLSRNSAIEGGGLYNDNVTNAVVSSTLIAGNILIAPTTGTDISGIFHSLGHNLIGDGSGASGFVASDQVGTSLVSIDPKIFVLSNYGGFTWTVALRGDSPAINRGDCTGNSTINPPAPAVLVDQRGFLRKSPCDVGAYETNPPQMTDAPNVTPANTVTATPTKIMGYHDAAGIPFVSPIS